MKKFILSVFILLMLSVPLTRANAVTFREGSNVTYDEMDPAKGSLFIAGQTVTIKGVVGGDIYCAGQTVTIDADVMGDVVCAAQILTITGDVDGNVRTVSQTLTATGAVGRNVTSTGQTFTFQNASVSGEMYVAGVSLTMQGSTVDGPVFGGFENATFSRTALGNDMNLNVANLTVDQESSVAGNLVYTSEKDAVIASESAIGGAVTRKEPVREQRSDRENKSPATSVRVANASLGISGLLLSIGFMIIVMLLWPGVFAYFHETLKLYPLQPLGYGILSLILAPIIILLLVMTIIGIPFVIAGLILWVLAVLVVRVFVAYHLGKKLVDTFAVNLKNNKYAMYITGAIGVGVIWASTHVPFVGGLISFIVLLYSAGSLILVILRKRNKISVKP